MKELNVALKSVVESLNTLSQEVEAIAKKLEKGFLEDKPSAKPKRKVVAKPKAKAVPKKTKAKAVQKTAKAPAKKKATAMDTVLTIITRSKKGVRVNVLSEKTGFDKKQISNILYKLKKAGKIQPTSRGVYSKV